MPQIKVNPKILQQLLDEPEVKETTANLTSDELEWYKQLLVSQHIYETYVIEKGLQDG